MRRPECSNSLDELRIARRLINADERERRDNIASRLVGRHPECRPAHYRFQGAELEMLINDEWVYVPHGMVQHRTLTGDLGETGGGHWCGERYEAGFITYCAFVPPNMAYLGSFGPDKP